MTWEGLYLPKTMETQTPTQILHFEGKQFVIYGYDAKKEEILRQLITKLGGTIQPNITEKTSFLITTPAEAKHLNRPVIQDAIKNGIPVVAEAFLWQFSNDIPETPTNSSSARTSINSIYMPMVNTSQDSIIVDVNSNERRRRPPSITFDYQPQQQFASFGATPLKNLSPSITIQESLEEHQENTIFFEPPQLDFSQHGSESNGEDYGEEDEYFGADDYEGDDDNDHGEGNERNEATKESLTTNRKKSIFTYPLYPTSSGNNTEKSTDLADKEQRLEWQRLLTTYLTGEEVESEKRKQQNLIYANEQEGIESIWLELRAKRIKVGVREAKRQLELERQQFAMILVDFVQSFDACKATPEETRAVVENILEQYDQFQSKFPSLKQMEQYLSSSSSSVEFMQRIDALQAWLTNECIFMGLMQRLRFRANCQHCSLDNVARKIAEEMLHTQSVDKLFKSRVCKDIDQAISQRRLLAEHHQLWTLMGLKESQVIAEICEFPVDLMRACLQTWLKSGKRLFDTKIMEHQRTVNTTTTSPQTTPKLELLLATAADKEATNQLNLIGIIQLMDDFKACIYVAMNLKQTRDEDDYQMVLKDCLQFYLKLLQTRFALDKSIYWYRAQEIIEQEWEYLKQISRFIEGGDVMMASAICTLIQRLTNAITKHIQGTMQPPSSPLEDTEKALKKYSKHLENVRLRARKIMQFIKVVFLEIETVTEHLLDQTSVILFMDKLQETKHVLIDAGLDDYLLISESSIDLTQLDDFFHSKFPEKSTGTPRQSQSFQFGTKYLLLIPKYFIIEKNWKSEWIKINPLPTLTDLVDGRHGKFELKKSSFLFLTRDGFQHNQCQRDFFERLKPLGFVDAGQRKSIYPRLNTQRSRLHSASTKPLISLINLIPSIRLYLTSGSPEALAKDLNTSDIVDLLENYFSFTSSLGVQLLPILPRNCQREIVGRLIHLSIEWITFTCSDCSPLDKKTFRWALMALEFVMWVTRGGNVLQLSNESFWEVRRKVACCMTLLISGMNTTLQDHADDLGEDGVDDDLDMLESMVNNLLIKNSTTTTTTTNNNDDDDEINSSIVQLEMDRNNQLIQQKKIGRVLDTTNPSYQHLFNLLSTSISTISIRWQQGKYLGGGTYGQVYLGINLDTGDLMAVKEIQFQQQQQQQQQNPQQQQQNPQQRIDASGVGRIQEEMRVLEQLNHPNVVQYYGIEIHRDKCLLFMEFCSNGSLRQLLDNVNRIEEEAIVSLYAYQLLDGVTYLHQQKIVHRDIKPDNILFDYSGVLKLVDFGAAKIMQQPQNIFSADKVAKNSLTGTPCYMSPEVVTGKTNSGVFGAQDIWAVGCVIVEMITGKRPWAHMDNEWAILYNIGLSHQHPQLPSDLSAVGLDLLKLCFLPAQQRPTARELLDHSFFTELKQRLSTRMSGTGAYPNPWASKSNFLSSPLVTTPSSLASSSSSMMMRLGSYFGSTLSSVTSTISSHLP